jgi:hypothetical protein
MDDWLLGGASSFAIDRDTLERAASAIGGIANARAQVRASRAFLGRAVRYMAEAGFDQFLEFGCGIPNSQDDLSTVARTMAPDAQVVLVDDDPTVLAHAHMIQRDGPMGGAVFIEAPATAVKAVLAEAKAGAGVDLTRPVGVLLIGVLDHLDDSDGPHRVVTDIVDASVPGSLVAIAHLTGDFAPAEVVAFTAVLNTTARVPYIPRDHGEISRLCTGLDLLDDGLVPIDSWRPDPNTPTAGSAAWKPAFYAGVGRRP